MSYQEERLQEIADAIREVKGTTEKIPATNFASEIVGLSVVKPSGIITIKENGSHNVANYEWAEVNVEADLNERVIIGKWVCEVVGAGVTYTLEFKDDGKCVFGVSHSGGDSIIELVYSTLGNQIHLSIDGDSMVAEYYNDNDTILLDFDGEPAIFTRVQETANLITKEITENGTYKASDDGADGYSEVVVNVPEKDPFAFANATPEYISQVASEIAYNNYTSTEVEAIYGWKIGDIKDIPLTTGEVIQMRIIGFNHDTLSDGSGTAGITLDMVGVLNGTFQLNNTNTVRPYYSTVMNTTTLPEKKQTLPVKWQNIIKPVDKLVSGYGGTYSMELFLLGESELTGTQGFSGFVDGKQYEYWKGKSNSDRIKTPNNNWWTRASSTSNRQVVVTGSGALFSNQYNTGTQSYAVSFAFCVGSAKDIVIAGLPIELSTDTEMTTALTQDNLGKVYKFTGTSDTYETDGIYIVSEV